MWAHFELLPFLCSFNKCQSLTWMPSVSSALQGNSMDVPVMASRSYGSIIKCGALRILSTVIVAAAVA